MEAFFAARVCTDTRRSAQWKLSLPPGSAQIPEGALDGSFLCRPGLHRYPKKRSMEAFFAYFLSRKKVG